MWKTGGRGNRETIKRERERIFSPPPPKEDLILRLWKRMGQEALQKNGIKISFVSKHFYQGLYCYFSLSQVKLILFRPLTHFVLFLASFEGHVPFASFPGWGICTPLPHSGVFVWICWPHCWTMFSQEKLTNARGELGLTEPLLFSFCSKNRLGQWWPILRPKNNLVE